jgi:hypothetical protein
MLDRLANRQGLLDSWSVERFGSSSGKGKTMSEKESVDAAPLHPIVIASVDEHRKRCNKDGFSKWYVTIDGKRRRIELQEYKSRLYLVGCLFSGLSKVLVFEESLDSIARKFGSVRSR